MCRNLELVEYGYHSGLYSIEAHAMAMNHLPAYGRRLLPQVLDVLATTDPAKVYASIPKSTDNYQRRIPRRYSN